MKGLIPQEVIEHRIFVIRGHKVMLDRDLAGLYGVSTKAFNQAVKRNIKRFPDDFMFRLTWKEVHPLRSQFVTLKDIQGEPGKRGRHIKYLPYAFTEQGVAMLSSVLKSERAIQVNIAIMRAFVRLREILSTNKKLACRLAELERRMEKKDEEIIAIFEAIRQLMKPPEKPKRQIGFHAYDD